MEILEHRGGVSKSGSEPIYLQEGRLEREREKSVPVTVCSNNTYRVWCRVLLGMDGKGMFSSFIGKHWMVSW